MNFEHWLGELLGESEHEIKYLLREETALRFLIAWSLFEAKCFEGFVKLDRLDAFAERLASEAYGAPALHVAAKHFHERYQDQSKYKNLIHGRDCRRMQGLLRTPLTAFQPADTIFFVAFVAYRYRNNMFHGSKGVQSWLQYKKQIALCVDALQSFVSHAEARRPTLQKEKAA